MIPAAVSVGTAVALLLSVRRPTSLLSRWADQ
jgi:hypothetical protein